MKSLSIAATGMLAQQTNVDVISNNIANMNTTGYKRFRPEFQDLLYQNLRRVGAESSDTGTIVPSGVQIGVGVKTASVYRITEQGSLITTGNPLDVAIQGTGYFQLQLPNGDSTYTRAGTFQLSPDGQIVNAEGFTVSPGISIPSDAVEITINANGQVLAKLDGQIVPQNVGTLDLVSFANGAGLDRSAAIYCWRLRLPARRRWAPRVRQAMAASNRASSKRPTLMRFPRLPRWLPPNGPTR